MYAHFKNETLSFFTPTIHMDTNYCYYSCVLVVGPITKRVAITLSGMYTYMYMYIHIQYMYTIHCALHLHVHCIYMCIAFTCTVHVYTCTVLYLIQCT